MREVVRERQVGFLSLAAERQHRLIPTPSLMMTMEHNVRGDLMKEVPENLQSFKTIQNLQIKDVVHAPLRLHNICVELQSVGFFQLNF